MKNKEHIEIQQEVYYPKGNMLTRPKEKQITEGGFSRLARLTAAMGKKNLRNIARTTQGATIDNAFQTKSGSAIAAVANANNKPGLNAALNQSQMKNVISSGGMKHPDSRNITTNHLRNGAAIGDPLYSSGGITDALGGPSRQVVSAGGGPGMGSNYGPNAGVTGYSGSAARIQRYKLSLQKEKAAAALSSNQKNEQQQYIADFIKNLLTETSDSLKQKLEHGRREFTPHETHILDIQQTANTQGRKLTDDEIAAIDRHRKNAVDSARRNGLRGDGSPR